MSVSSKNTKSEILDYVSSLESSLKKAQEKIKQEKSKHGVDSKAELAVKQKETKLVEAKEIDVQSTIADFRLKLNEATSGFEKFLLEKQEKFDKLNEAITIAEDELKQLYGIIKEANTFEALLRAQSEEKEKFKESKEALEKDWKSKFEKLASDYEEKERELKKRYDHLAEDSAYNFKKQRKENQDEINEQKKIQERDLFDQKRLAEQEIADTKKEVELALAEAVKKQTEHAEEFNRLKEFEEQFEEIKSKAVRDALLSQEQNYKLQHKYELDTAQKDFEVKTAKIQTENENLKTNVTNLQEQVKELSKQLSNAYSKIESVSKEAIQGASKAKVYVSNDTKNKD